MELIQRLRHCRLRAYLLWRVHDNSRTLQRPSYQVTSRDYESNILVGTAICYPHCLKPRRCSSYPGLRGPRSKWRRMWFLFSNSSSLWLFSRYLWTTLLGHQSCSLRRRGYPSSWRPSQGNPFLHSLRLLQHNRYFRSQQSLVFFSVDRNVCVELWSTGSAPVWWHPAPFSLLPSKVRDKILLLLQSFNFFSLIKPSSETP